MIAFIRHIFQKDQTRFTIEWTDGKLKDYRLSDLQRACPCAVCGEKKTGDVRVDPEVEAVRIVNVGRYALRIEFTSGCSQGIYPFGFLHKF
jgi:ATP-binding protein involved in chromosome partitioning